MLLDHLADHVARHPRRLMVSRGSPSLSFLHTSATAIRAAHAEGKRSYIYQFGDHDPTGVMIPQSMLRRLTEMTEQLGCPPPTLKRAALTEAQIRRHRLPTRPTKRDGNSHATNFEGDSVELDALAARHIHRDLQDHPGQGVLLAPDFEIDIGLRQGAFAVDLRG
jgi:hypothetical protein